jgi:hypothetical protein
VLINREQVGLPETRHLYLTSTKVLDILKKSQPFKGWLFNTVQ